MGPAKRQFRPGFSHYHSSHRVTYGPEFAGRISRSQPLRSAPPQREECRLMSLSKTVPQHRPLQEALRESEDRYRTLFESIDEGFCVVEMIFDRDDKPVDYCFLETNPSFDRQTGLQNAQGKRMRELVPQHEQHWFDTYGRVALTGEPVRFQNRAEQLQRWYDVYAFRFGEPERRLVAILFNDISARKQ